MLSSINTTHVLTTMSFGVVQDCFHLPIAREFNLGYPIDFLIHDDLRDALYLIDLPIASDWEWESNTQQSLFMDEDHDDRLHSQFLELSEHTRIIGLYEEYMQMIFVHLMYCKQLK